MEDKGINNALRIIMNYEKYVEICHEVRVNSYANKSTYQEILFDIEKAPTILVFDNNNIVLRTHDFNELLNFFIKQINQYKTA